MTNMKITKNQERHMVLVLLTAVFDEDDPKCCELLVSSAFIAMRFSTAFKTS